MAGLPFDTGVHIVEGVPGSGKSYVCVLWVIQAILEQRRPVYTNLPIKFRVLRAYLRRVGGPEIASLLHRLTPELFETFAARGHLYRNFKEEQKGLARRQGVTVCEDDIDRRFQERYGPNITDSDDPACNWVPVGSLVIYDEIQHHYPMKNQAKEGSELLDYLTIHRHFVQQFIAVTQDKMNISNTIRKVAEYYWEVSNRRDHKLIWGIRFKHLGITAFAYKCWTKSALDAPIWSDAHAPMKNYTVYPFLLPRFRRIFKFYDSFTAAGSLSRINETIARTRVQAGLTPSGHTPAEVRYAQEQAMRITKRQSRKFRHVVTAGLVCVCFLCVFVVGAALGTTFRKALPSTPEPLATLPSVSTPTAQEAPHQWPQLRSVGPDFIRTSTGRYAVGMTDPHGNTLTMIDPDSRLALVRSTAGYALLSLRAAPRFLGSPDVFEQRLRAYLNDATGSTPSSSVSAPSRPSPAPLTPSPGA